MSLQDDWNEGSKNVSSNEEQVSDHGPGGVSYSSRGGVRVGGSRGSVRGGRGGAIIKPRGAPMPLSSVVVSAPPQFSNRSLGGDSGSGDASMGESGRNKHGGGGGIGASTRFESQQLPPRLQRKIEERGRGGRRSAGTGLVVSTRPGKEASPDGPDKEWETASDNSDPDAKEKNAKKGASLTASTQHKQGK